MPCSSYDQSSVFTLTPNEHNNNMTMKSYLKSFKASKEKSLSKLYTLFRRQKFCKQSFLSFQSFKVFNETVFKSNSSPDMITIQNNNDNRYNINNNFVYSNIYFKHNQPLFGYKIDLCNVSYDFNNLKIYPTMHRDISYEYVPIFHRKILNKSNSGVLLFHAPLIERLKNSRKSINKLNKNTKIFKNYTSAIIYNHKNETDNCNLIKNYSYRNSHNYNKTYRFMLRTKNYVDLDEISPVDDDTQMTSSPFNQQHHRRKRTDDRNIANDENETFNNNNQYRRDDNSDLDTNIIILQPLNLDSMKINNLNKDKQILSDDHKKLVRLTIFYTLSFFALAIITFFIIYLT